MVTKSLFVNALNCVGDRTISQVCNRPSIYHDDPADMPFDFTELLACLAPRAVFINAPTGDDNFDVSGVEDCINAARPVYQEIFRADRNLQVIHLACPHDFPPEAREAAYKFLAKALR